ncbi:helix-turn-helix transcriptional regulator [Cohnella thailandensis]|uniref:Helix-turn-helix transcriptional regulator n=1 Tax=Cohnella thailandensis TaxID=557557 RepID=A0A841ST15_9BACL|nr:AraC family transcriptional regulator [Cohnella thailandensis]MBB6634119.1 helix-turn-helix transcriptional regulator [Cohnella thailandensis]MBP1972388.1 AraC-like DNA-binding protein [Cohnella thailandensis]
MPITPNPNPAFLGDMLEQLQVQLVETYYTECTPMWREIDYVPSYNKLYLIAEGEGWLRIDGEEYRPVAGQLVHMPAHVLQSYSALEGRPPYAKYWCHFTATMGGTDLFQWLDLPHVINVSPSLMVKLVALFRELTELYQDRGYLARIREKAVLLEIVAGFLSEASPQPRIVPGRSGELERMKRIEAYIDARMHETITLEQLAKHVHLHPNYLVRYFNKHFAVPPLKYLNRKRMQKAKSLLLATDLSVKEIGELVGYPDTNHFAKAFRKETSCSPTVFRLRAVAGNGRAPH